MAPGCENRVTDSPSLIELARRGYETFNRTGAPDFALLDPDIEWTEGPESPDPQVYHGHEGVRSQQEQFRAAWESYRFDPEQVIQEGDKLVVILRMWARGRTSGVEVEARLAHVFTMRDGKVIRFEVWGDPAKALESVGRGSGR